MHSMEPERRFEQKGSFNGVTVVDDYAHHPTEIAATLHAAEKFPHKHLWCVFQPHTYSRTRALLPEFAKALSKAEHILLVDIYAAREKDPGDISSRTLQEEIKKHGKDALYFPSFEEAEKYLSEKCIDGDLINNYGSRKRSRNRRTFSSEIGYPHYPQFFVDFF